MGDLRRELEQEQSRAEQLETDLKRTTVSTRTVLQIMVSLVHVYLREGGGEVAWKQKLTVNVSVFVILCDITWCILVHSTPIHVSHTLIFSNAMYSVLAWLASGLQCCVFISCFKE